MLRSIAQRSFWKIKIAEALGFALHELDLDVDLMLIRRSDFYDARKDVAGDLFCSSRCLFSQTKPSEWGDPTEPVFGASANGARLNSRSRHSWSQ
jgi:hypothetical protein